MAAPFFSTPFQPFVYQSPQDAVTPFQILGGEAQIVQIMLKPQERIIAKPGSMCYMSGSIQMENVYATENEAGFWQWLFGKNTTSIVLHNTVSMCMLVCINPEIGEKIFFVLAVGRGGPRACRGATMLTAHLHYHLNFFFILRTPLAKILGPPLAIDLAKFGGEILCQPDLFLCSINDVKVSNTIDQRPRNLVASAEVEPLTDMLVTFPGILKAEDIGPRACFRSWGWFWYDFEAHFTNKLKSFMEIY
ncbi:hypothetical protein KY289_034606 [Solanum tuberosum]|nr:hypothetical protein KY289_034606 [Solanum tuberosum]